MLRLVLLNWSVSFAGWVGGCGTFVVFLVGGFGTLLGPEESGRPCLLWGLSGWLLCPSFACSWTVVRGWGLVGLLFEICIVDASIFVAIVLLCL